MGSWLTFPRIRHCFRFLETTYGGDGRVTFALPDLRSRVPIHAGTGPGLPNITLGKKGGIAEITLGVKHLPSHTHTVQVNSTLAINASTGTNLEEEPSASTTFGGANIYTEEAPNEALASGTLSGEVTATALNVGSGEAFDNMQPFLGLKYIIATQGLYPSRN